jgi:hypothetical protein
MSCKKSGVISDNQAVKYTLERTMIYLCLQYILSEFIGLMVANLINLLKRWLFKLLGEQGGSTLGLYHKVVNDLGQIKNAAKSRNPMLRAL